MQKLVLVFISFNLILFSCKTTKQGTDALPGLPTTLKGKYQTLQERNVNFETLTIKNFKIKIDAEGRNNTLYGSLKLVKNKSALLSLRAGLGFEISRILLTPYSITISNRQEKKVYVSDYQKIKPLLPLPLSLNYIQNIFIGNVPEKGKVESIPEPVNPLENQSFLGAVNTVNTESPDTYSIWFDRNSLRPVYMIIYQKNMIEPLHVEYGKYKQESGYKLPEEFTISYKKKGIKNFIHLDCENFEFGEEESLRISYSDKYEVIHL